MDSREREREMFGLHLVLEIIAMDLSEREMLGLQLVLEIISMGSKEIISMGSERESERRLHEPPEEQIHGLEPRTETFCVWVWVCASVRACVFVRMCTVAEVLHDNRRGCTIPHIH